MSTVEWQGERLKDSAPQVGPHSALQLSFLPVAPLSLPLRSWPPLMPASGIFQVVIVTLILDNEVERKRQGQFHFCLQQHCAVLWNWGPMQTSQQPSGKISPVPGFKIANSPIRQSNSPGPSETWLLFPSPSPVPEAACFWFRLLSASNSSCYI